MRRESKAELTWTKAVMIGLGISAFLLVTLAWVPSFFTYWWDGKAQQIIDLVQNLLRREIQPYTNVRLRDAISMGYQSTVFAAVIAAAYIVNERRRRRRGQRGADEVKGYLPGK